jgi:hypothetical protein
MLLYYSVLNFMHFYYRLIVNQRPFYLAIHNDSNLMVIDGPSSDNKIT